MSRTTRLWVVLASNLALVGGLLIVGLSAHSLGVFAEGADYVADAAAIAVALLASWLSSRPTGLDGVRRYAKAPTVAAAVNAGWLLILSLLVIAGATDRLIRGTQRVHGLPVLIVSGVAALVMLGGALLLGGDIDDVGDDDDLTMRAVLLDTAADAAAAAGVAVSGGIIATTGGLYWLDPLVALLISSVVGFHTLKLLSRVRRRLWSPV